MRTCFLSTFIPFLIELISTFQLNRICTFTNIDQCQLNFGRRWQIRQLDDDIEDHVLIATGQSEEDERLGYTDSVIFPWLQLSSICSNSARLLFQLNVDNDRDRLEIYLRKRNGTQIGPIAQWRTTTNETDQRESQWQQANVTLEETDEFQIHVEVRHFARQQNDSISWFALDEILIEHCPNVRTSTSKSKSTKRIFPTWTKPWYMANENWSSFNRSFFHFRWKFNNSDESLSSIDDESVPPRFTFLNFLLYFLYMLVGLGLLTIVFVVIISAYRKYCLPSNSTWPGTIHYRYRMSRKKKVHRSTRSQGPETQTDKTMITTIRSS